MRRWTSRSRLSDEAERATAGNVERHPVHRVHLSSPAAEEHAAGEREELLEALDGDSGAACFGAPPLPAIAGRWAKGRFTLGLLRRTWLRSRATSDWQVARNGVTQVVGSGAGRSRGQTSIRTGRAGGRRGRSGPR